MAFNLYFEGYTAQEIASMLSVSINTIKTHNGHIFAKLNVSSRKELLTWVQLLTASGRLLDDSGMNFDVNPTHATVLGKSQYNAGAFHLASPDGALDFTV